MSHQPDNIFAGTQVVSLIEVRGTNNSLVHPRGAVGVVTRTPTGDQNQFLVRFPDGFEASFTREKLEVLKHFKDRLGAPNSGSARIIGAPVSDPARSDSEGRASSRAEERRPDTGFDLESFIIYRCVVGSRAYGLDNEESDTDRRGIYLAPAELQWSLFGAPEQFEDNATQSCYWELQKFLAMGLKANPNILECLYSPMVKKVTPLGADLVLISFFLPNAGFRTDLRTAIKCPIRLDDWICTPAPELEWVNSIHPGFDEAEELKRVRTRYDVALRGLKYTLERLRENSEFRSVVTKLRGKGWKDWHVLQAMLNAVANFRTTEKVGRFAGQAEFMKVFKEESFSGERPDSLQVLRSAPRTARRGKRQEPWRGAHEPLTRRT